MQIYYNTYYMQIILQVSTAILRMSVFEKLRQSIRPWFDSIICVFYFLQRYYDGTFFICQQLVNNKTIYN